MGCGRSPSTWRVSPVSGCPGASRAQIRAQIWVLTSGFLLSIARGDRDPPLFRPDISQVGADRARVMRCGRALLLAVGCCRCCQGHPRFLLRPPDLLIRRNGQTIHHCPSLPVRWPKIPDLSLPVNHWRAAWQQCWLQSRPLANMLTPSHSVVRRG